MFKLFSCFAIAMMMASSAFASELKVFGTWTPKHYNKLIGPFEKANPNIKVNFQKLPSRYRVIRPIISYKSGKVVADVIVSIGSRASTLHQLGMSIPLHDQLQNWNNVPEYARDNINGHWVGFRRTLWCTSYNTTNKNLKLPETWNQVVNMNIGRKLGVSRSGLIYMWSALWSHYGEEWGHNALASLKRSAPEIRKETSAAVIKLTGAGEFTMSFPAQRYRVINHMSKGANIAVHCPTPIPAPVSAVAVINGPNKINALKFVDYMLSDEFQKAQASLNMISIYDKYVDKQLDTSKFVYIDQRKREHLRKSFINSWTKYWP